LPNDGVVRVLRDKKGRGGKTVTVVAGLPGGTTAVAETAARLKRLCGSGGTVRDGAIEIQGDHRERIAEALRAQGLTVKLAGG
jgi:translation initiation factor 1